MMIRDRVEQQTVRSAIATCPLSQPLEVASTYRRVRDGLLQGRLSPQILVRLGWAPTGTVPATRRRPLDDVCEVFR